MEADDADPSGEMMTILGSVAEVKGAADANGQTLELNFLACSDDKTEEEMKGKKFLMVSVVLPLNSMMLPIMGQSFGKR